MRQLPWAEEVVYIGDSADDPTARDQQIKFVIIFLGDGSLSPNEKCEDDCFGL